MRIAQVTDLHLRQHQPGSAAVAIRRSREMVNLLTEALERILTQDVDLLAITGDLLDVPQWLYRPAPGFEVDDPAYWEATVEADYRLIKDILDATGLLYMVLPGNHDWDAVMWRVFDPNDNVQEVADRRVVRFCDHEYAGGVPRRFHPQRTRWANELARNDGLRQIHLQHFVITPALNEGYPHTYGEGESLRRGIVDAGTVDLCLSGHYHRGTDLLQHDSVCFATGPAFCEPPFPWRIYEVSDGDVTVEEHALRPSKAATQPAVFLDRDGVINDLASYRFGPERMRLLPGAAQAVRALRDAGYVIVVVTNQSCIGLGYVPEEVVHCVNDRMSRLLWQEAGAEIDAVYYAKGAGDCAVLPHYRDTAASKPGPALLLRAQQDLNLCLTRSWMVGDQLTDAQAAHAANVRPILVRTGAGRQQEPAYLSAFPEGMITADLPTAASWVLSKTHAAEANECMPTSDRDTPTR